MQGEEAQERPPSPLARLKQLNANIENIAAADDMLGSQKITEIEIIFPEVGEIFDDLDEGTQDMVRIDHEYAVIAAIINSEVQNLRQRIKNAMALESDESDEETEDEGSDEEAGED